MHATKVVTILVVGIWSDYMDDVSICGNAIGFHCIHVWYVFDAISNVE